MEHMALDQLVAYRVHEAVYEVHAAGYGDAGLAGSLGDVAGGARPKHPGERPVVLVEVERLQAAAAVGAAELERLVHLRHFHELLHCDEPQLEEDGAVDAVGRAVHRAVEGADAHGQAHGRRRTHGARQAAGAH